MTFVPKQAGQLTANKARSPSYKKHNGQRNHQKEQTEKQKLHTSSNLETVILTSV